jgi:geranylgeranyl pyrophosphate synthase
MIPLTLRARESRMEEYLRRENVRLSPVLENILRHAYGTADPLCSTMTLWTCEACGGDANDALPVAAAIECLHRFAMIHDDLIGWQALRGRGEPVAARWGVAQAVNAGDAYHGLALRLISAQSRHPERILSVSIDIEREVLRAIERRSRLLRRAQRGPRVARRRIAYAGAQSTLLAAAMRAGAVMAGATTQVAESLARAGRNLGVVIDLASSLRERGKSSVARRYAAIAVSDMKRCALPDAYVHEFEEIAHQLAAGD